MPRLRHNLSDPSLRSGFGAGIAGRRRVDESPRIGVESAPGSVHGGGSANSGSPVSSPAPRPTRSSSSGALSRGGTKRADPTGHTAWLPVGQEQSSRARRNRGDRRPLYVPTVNDKPIPLRGGGRGGASEAVANAALGAEHRTPSSSSFAAPASSATSIATRTPAPKSEAFTDGGDQAAPMLPDASLRRPTVCSIATPTATPVASAREPDGEFQRQLQETRDRLASLELEQRKLINTSLGALVKAAHAMSSPSGRSPSKLLPSVSTFTCRSPASAAGESSPARELPADTVMVLAADAASSLGRVSSVPSPGSASPTAASIDTLIANGGGLAASERLEVENQQLRDAIANVNVKNGELAAMCQAAEARSLLLVEENRSAAEELTQKGGMGTSQNAPSDLVASLRSQTEHGVDAAADAEQARRELLLTSTDVERRLKELFTRRGKLQTVFNTAEASAVTQLSHAAFAR